MKDKILNGFLWGVGFFIAFFVCLKISDVVSSYFYEDRIQISHTIEKFKIESSTHRFVRDEFGNPFLVIVGEVSSTDFGVVNSLSITAELTNSNDEFSDSCIYTTHLTEQQTKVPFKILCNHITKSEQFQNYEFTLSGMQW